MIADVLRERLSFEEGGLVYGRNRVLWSALLIAAERLARECGAFEGARVAVTTEDPLLAAALLFALDDLKCDLILLPAGALDPAVYGAEVLLRPLKGLRVNPVRLRVTENTAQERALGAAVTVFSSGTAGLARPHRWEWAALRARLHVPTHAAGGVWAGGYAIDTFAGVHFLFSACAAAREVVLLGPNQSLCTALEGIPEIRLTAGTPSFWRRTLLTEPADALRSHRIQTISMGGEIADNDLLVRLGRVFPDSRRVHVYASSEHGPLFSVSDGLPGFPASWLERPLHSGTLLTVVNGELLVSRDGGVTFTGTGDMVGRDCGRIHFLGRRDEQINVGGRKVSPLSVEAVLRQVPGVADARTYGLSSRLTGAVVAADLVLFAGFAPEQVRVAVHERFRAELPNFARPRRLRFVAEIPVNRAGKTTRLGASDA